MMTFLLVDFWISHESGGGKEDLGVRLCVRGKHDFPSPIATNHTLPQRV